MNKEAIQRIRANVAESTDLAVTTIERLTEVCEEALRCAERPGASDTERARLRAKLREALGMPHL